MGWLLMVAVLASLQLNPLWCMCMLVRKDIAGIGVWAVTTPASPELLLRGTWVLLVA
jgi:hypothetical protein